MDAGEHKFAGSLCAVLATEGPQEARDAVEEELVELCEALWVQARKVGPANAVFEDLANAVLRAAEARLSCERLRAMTTVLQLEKDRGAYARSMRKCAHLGMWRVVVQATAFEVGRNGDADDDRHCCDLFACRAALLYLGGGEPPAHVDRLLTSLSEMLQLDGIPGADEAESSPLALRSCLRSRLSAPTENRPVRSSRRTRQRCSVTRLCLRAPSGYFTWSHLRLGKKAQAGK